MNKNLAKFSISIFSSIILSSIFVPTSNAAKIIDNVSPKNVKKTQKKPAPIFKKYEPWNGTNAGVLIKKLQSNNTHERKESANELRKFIKFLIDCFSDISNLPELTRLFSKQYALPIIDACNNRIPQFLQVEPNIDDPIDMLESMSKSLLKYVKI